MGSIRSTKAVQAAASPPPSVLTDIEAGADGLTLGRAAGLSILRRNGRSTSGTTLWRWHVHGANGVKLEAVRIGGALITTELAIRRFIERSSDPTLPAHAPTPGESARAHRRAGAVLDGAGVR